MILLRVLTVFAISLQLSVLVTARHLPNPEDLQAEALELVDIAKRDVSEEGSGDDDLHPIHPMPAGITTMERLEEAPQKAEKESIEEQASYPADIDEGSGFYDDTKSKAFIADGFDKEAGMEEVISSLAADDDEEKLETTDHNRHDNTLNVIADRSLVPLEEEPIVNLAPETENKEDGEGSGQVPAILPAVDSDSEENAAEDIHTHIHLPAESNTTKDEGHASLIAATELTDTEIVATTEHVPAEVATEEPVAELTTTKAPEVAAAEDHVPPVEPEVTDTTASTEVPTTMVPSSTETPVPALPEIVPTETTIEDRVETTMAPETTQEDQHEDLVEMTTISAEETPSTEPTEIETTTETDSIVEEINGTVLVPAVLGETVRVTAEEPASQLEPKSSSIGWYYVVGLLAVCLVILIAVVALRNRKRSHKIRTEIGQDRDTEKSLLSNGRFKEDSEDNNVKNNEITPLVIKQNSQINKFEKSPNFSSPKNLNVQAQDKNIEKDNVLKSTQAIIEDEADDAKKEVDEEDKNKAEEELNPLTAEKVVVRTHIDLDSIPRKPIVINRNGHSYLAVPGGETKT